LVFGLSSGGPCGSPAIICHLSEDITFGNPGCNEKTKVFEAEFQTRSPVAALSVRLGQGIEEMDALPARGQRNKCEEQNFGARSSRESWERFLAAKSCSKSDDHSAQAG
jgi:hypothetical protein